MYCPVEATLFRKQRRAPKGSRRRSSQGKSKSKYVSSFSRTLGAKRCREDWAKYEHDVGNLETGQMMNRVPFGPQFGSWQWNNEKPETTIITQQQYWNCITKGYTVSQNFVFCLSVLKLESLHWFRVVQFAKKDLIGNHWLSKLLELR